MILVGLEVDTFAELLRKLYFQAEAKLSHKRRDGSEEGDDDDEGTPEPVVTPMSKFRISKC
jgi:hypothetical protein